MAAGVRKFLVLIGLAACAVSSAWAWPRTTLVVNKSGNGTGVVKSAAGAIDCGSRCTAQYTLPAWVRLTTTDGTGIFQGWEGDCSGNGECNVWLRRNRSITAKFVRPKLTVTLQTGVGQPLRVVSSPAGIDCPGRCEAEFDAHSIVTLDPTMPPGFIGICVVNGCGGPIRMDEALIQDRVRGEETVSVFIGRGNGTVVSTPAPMMRCPDLCKAAVPVGQTVFLRATGSVTWQGQNCLEGRQDSNVCSFVVTGLMAASVVFNGGSVTFFRDINFQGPASQPLPNGRLTMDRLREFGMPNDWASSVKVPPGITVDMFQDDNFLGQMWTLTADTPDFTRLNPSPNDQVSSIHIHQ